MTVLSLFSVLSCSSTEDELASTLVTQVVEEGESIRLDSLIDQIEMVQLKGDFLLSGISDFVFVNDTLVVLDKMQKNIKIFNKEFQFIKTINNFGAGPGQYRDVSGLASAEGMFYIFSNEQASHFYYNLNGEFVKKVRLRGHPFSSLTLGDKVVTYQNFNKSEQEDYNLKSWENEELRNKLFPIKKTLPILVGYSGGMSRDLNEVERFNYSAPLTDSIFVINSDLEIVEQYKIKGLVKNGLEKGIYADNFDVSSRNTNGYMASLNNTFSGYSWLYYKDPPALRTAFLDLNNNVYYRIGRKDRVNRDISGLLNSVRAEHDGFIYSVTNPLFVNKFNKLYVRLLKEKGFEDEEIDSDDLHFIVRFKLK